MKKETIKNNQTNPIKEWWNNIRHTKSNLRKVRASPYASLVFSLKVRKMIIIPLIGYLIWRGIDMVINYKATGAMEFVGKIFITGIFVYMVYRIYRTIPDAKKQIAYYKKYPHVINYCPTDVKEDVDDILNKVKNNKLKLMEAEKNVQKKRKTKGSSGRNQKSTTNPSNGTRAKGD